MLSARSILILILLFISGIAGSQTREIDSMLVNLEKLNPDTIKLIALDNLTEAIIDELKWPAYNEQMGALAKELIKSKNEKIRRCAKKYYANYLNNLGVIYTNRFQLSSAIDYYQKGYAIQEELGDKYGMATTLNNVGTIYDQLEEYQEALKYFRNSLLLYTKIKDKRSISFSYGNIGGVYVSLDRLWTALDFYLKGLKICEEINDKNGMAVMLRNIATIFIREKKYDKAAEYLAKSKKMAEENNDTYFMSFVYLNLATLNYKLNKIDLATSYATKAMTEAKKYGYPDMISKSAELLSLLYKTNNHYKEALQMHELFTKMRDSFNTNDVTKKLIQNRLQRDYEKKSFSDSIKLASRSIPQEKEMKEIEFEKTEYFYAFVTTLLLLLVSIAINYSLYKKTKG